MRGRGGLHGMAFAPAPAPSWETPTLSCASRRAVWVPVISCYQLLTPGCASVSVCVRASVKPWPLPVRAPPIVTLPVHLGVPPPCGPFSVTPGVPPGSPVALACVVAVRGSACPRLPRFAWHPPFAPRSRLCPPGTARKRHSHLLLHHVAQHTCWHGQHSRQGGTVSVPRVHRVTNPARERRHADRSNDRASMETDLHCTQHET